MKKITGIILAFILVLGCFPVFAEETTSVSLAPDTENAIKLLSVLNIHEFEANTLNKAVTRQEFAAIVYKLITGIGFPEEHKEECVYDDVTDAAYIPYINALSRLKVISGFSDGTFRPENLVTLNEIFTVMVRALGYDVIAEANGGYPGGYIFTAMALGITKGVDLSANIVTTGDLAVILKNTLLAEVKVKNSYSPNGKIEFSEDTTTLLYSVYKVDVIKDVVNGIDITKLSGESSVPPWNILIGTTTVKIGELNPNHLLGYSVEAYYNYETETLIYIEPTNKNSTVVIDVTDIEKIANNEIERMEDGKVIENKYSPLTDFIYNNGATETPLSMDLLKDKNGTLTLIDNNGDKKYDVIKADVYYDVIVDYVSPAEKKAYDLISGQPLSLEIPGSANPYVLLDDGTGAAFDVDSLAKYTVLSVYETMPDSSQQYIRIIKNNLRANGIVTESTYDDKGRFVVYVDDKPIIFTNTGKNEYESLIKAGENISILLNAEGKAAGIAHYVPGVLKYGMIMQCGYREKDLEREIFARIYTQQDMSTDVYFANNVEIDNVIYKEDDIRILNHLAAGAEAAGTVQHGQDDKRYMQVVRYSLDKEGRLDTIDTVLNSYDPVTTIAVAATIKDDPDTANSLFIGPSSPTNECEFLSGARAIDCGRGVLVGGSTIVFKCPGVNETVRTDYSAEENYSYAGTSVDLEDRRFTSYYANAEDITASVITYHFSAAGGGGDVSSHYFGVFDKMTKGIDDNGGIGNKIYYWYSGEYRTQFAETNAGWTDTEGVLGEKGKRYTIADLKEGDAVRFMTNGEGKISSFYLYARGEGDIKVGEDQWPTQWRNSNRRVGGFIYKIYENGAAFVQGDDRSLLADNPSIQQLRDTVPVVVYDSSKREGQRLEKGTLKSAISYLKDPENCSRAYLNSRGGIIYMIYVVR